MNKKLFSWKALAGLALLVAMGLTSCTGDTVDPTDPEGTSKPVTPGASTTGSADLTLTLAQPSDFASVWKKNVDDKTKEALAKKSEITIVLKTSGMTLPFVYKSDKKTVDTDATKKARTLTLPSIYEAGKTANKIVNLVMEGSFKDVKSNKGHELYIVTKSLSDGVVAITLPANTEESMYSIFFTAGNSVPSVSTASETFLDKFEVLTGQDAKKALTLNSGINVARVPETSKAINIAGAYLATLETAAAVKTAGNNGNNTNGVALPNGNGDANGVWSTSDITVQALGFGKALDNVVIAKGVTAEVNGWGAAAWNHNELPYVNNIVGLGDNSKKATASKLTSTTPVVDAYNNKYFQFSNCESISNVWITDDDWFTFYINDDIFEDVVIEPDVVINSTVDAIDNITFKKDVVASVPGINSSFTFTNVDFNGDLDMAIPWSKDLVNDWDEVETEVTYWYYDLEANDGTWVQVTTFAKVPAANKALDKEGGVLTSFDDAVDVANNNTNKRDAVRNAHYWYAHIEYLEEPYEKEDYSITVNLDECTYGTNAITNKNLNTLVGYWGGNMYCQFRVDGQLYKWRKTTTGTGWRLVASKE